MSVLLSIKSSQDHVKNSHGFDMALIGTTKLALGERALRLLLLPPHFIYFEAHKCENWHKTHSPDAATLQVLPANAICCIRL